MNNSRDNPSRHNCSKSNSSSNSSKNTGNNNPDRASLVFPLLPLVVLSEHVYDERDEAHKFSWQLHHMQPCRFCEVPIHFPVFDSSAQTLNPNPKL